ncbi:hypothetical protein J7L60_04440 [Candidatus Bathyarchaeota archaeon]|nr:hypothetical protein [Candidatus Bathyarchaeota archaeon]
MRVGAKKVVHMIPVSLYSLISKRLIGIILETKKTESLPTSLAKSILYLWQRDQLDNAVGIEKLLEAAMFVEPERTLEFFREIGLQEILVPLKEAFR